MVLKRTLGLACALVIALGVVVLPSAEADYTVTRYVIGSLDDPAGATTLAACLAGSTSYDAGLFAVGVACWGLEGGETSVTVSDDPSLVSLGQAQGASISFGGWTPPVHFCGRVHLPIPAGAYLVKAVPDSVTDTRCGIQDREPAMLEFDFSTAACDPWPS